MISERFAIPITELVFVGDEDKDRKTALNSGCKFVRMQRVGKSEEGIRSLYELLEMLE